MHHDQRSVGGALHIKLYHIYAQITRTLKSKHSVFRPQASAAAMRHDQRSDRFLLR
jgi:hypothetical protein